MLQRTIALMVSRQRHSSHLVGSFLSVSASFSSISHQYPNAKTISGEECYRKAMSILKGKEHHMLQVEEQEAKEQYDAMLRANRKEAEREEKSKHVRKKGKAAGVAVIRTIARQSREKLKKDKKQSGSVVDKNKTIDQNNNKKWDEMALYYMQHAGLIYGYAEALVQLGNEALEEANRHKKHPIAKHNSFSLLYPHLYGKDSHGKHVTIYGIPDHSSELADNSNIEADLVEFRNTSSSSPLLRALKLYKLAGERGSVDGWYNLGHLLWMGHPPGIGELTDEYSTAMNKGLKPNQTEAIESFQKAIDLGDGDANFFVGVQYLAAQISVLPKQSNLGQSKIRESDMRLYGLNLVRKAGIDLSHGGALHYLALFYRSGDEELEIPPCSDEEFCMYLDKACDAGNADAFFLRSHCLYKGEDGYEKDYGAALQGFLQSAKEGNADAAISAGAMYYQGGFNGAVSRDQRRAFELYQDAAEMGSKEGWRNLVSCYSLGEGVPQCEKTARYIADTMLST